MKERWTIPNTISVIRLASVPLLLWLAWSGERTLFLIAIILVMLTDVADGYIARHYHQQSELGSRLDTGGDLAIYFSGPVAIWWLWPEVVVAQWPWVALAVAAFLLPILVALLKFGTVTSYHTWAAKATAMLLSLGILLLLTLGTTWLFHIGCLLLLYTGVEEIAISLLLRRRLNNIPTLWHLLRNNDIGSPPP